MVLSGYVRREERVIFAKGFRYMILKYSFLSCSGNVSRLFGRGDKNLILNIATNKSIRKLFRNI